MKKIFLFFILYMLPFAGLFAQDVTAMVQKIKAKIEQVKDYQARGTMTTNVPFLKVPEAQVTVYFKAPGHLKIKNENGISLVPRGAVSISLGNLLKGSFMALDAGTDTAQGKKLKLIKLLPSDENSDIAVSTLYVDETSLLVIKARTTTRESGSYEVEMYYGKYAAWALPDKVKFIFNTKDYKLPKGITFDYDDGSKKKPAGSAVNTKGMVEISYASYIINKGLDDRIFQ